ncbi:SCO6745 family protein [Pseudonocardia adelaidensis]|uniref:SalK n=1 Tax=Pseudonocardia adelaidensis TaxID=648754 RepID=A0ABP9NT76_9PSEU
MTERALLERELWRTLEAVHAVVYFTPDAKAAYGALGLRGYWMGYFASRSAALGSPGPRLVTALFYGFAPRMVERALPDAWGFADPEGVLDARLELARSALAPHAGDGLDGAADLLTSVLAALDVSGRPLAAAHLDVPVPADPLSRIWHAATVLREYRGDGHVAELVSAQVDGVECHRLHGGSLVSQQREFRGWTEEEWAAAGERLRARGLVDAAGEQTPRGRELRTGIERGTDRSAAAALRTLDDGGLRVLRDVLGPVARSLATAGAVPYPNAMGVARP